MGLRIGIGRSARDVDAARRQGRAFQGERGDIEIQRRHGLAAAAARAGDHAASESEGPLEQSPGFSHSAGGEQSADLRRGDDHAAAAYGGDNLDAHAEFAAEFKQR